MFDEAVGEDELGTKHLPLLTALVKARAVALRSALAFKCSKNIISDMTTQKEEMQAVVDSIQTKKVSGNLRIGKSECFFSVLCLAQWILS